jgi:hypothetical protein
VRISTSADEFQAEQEPARWSDTTTSSVATVGDFNIDRCPAVSPEVDDEWLWLGIGRHAILFSREGGDGVERSELLEKMVPHVRYELDKMIDFVTMGNAWNGVLRPELEKLAHESILEAALIHTRCIAEFLRRPDGEDSNDPARSVIVARDFVPTWHWTE